MFASPSFFLALFPGSTGNQRLINLIQIVRALDGDVSLEILNEGSKRGQSTTFSSSSDYDASLYSSNMKHFRTVALESNDYSNGYSGATSEYGLNPSETSSSGDVISPDSPKKHSYHRL